MVGGITLSSLLRACGHQVWTAYGGRSGIELALLHRPEVALADIAMPDIDGYEVARELRKRLPHMVLIAVTGRAQDAARAREAGFNHHLAKPVEIRRLQDLLAALPPRSPDGA